jgi:hypothetical protein
MANVNFKLNLKSLSRQQLFAAIGLSACCLLGAGLGWASMSASLKMISLQKKSKTTEPELAFLVPPLPPQTAEVDEAVLGPDPAQLRVWEAAVRQPMPPRKEALTPPVWRIVGVTMIGNEKNVLLLFGKQAATEARKIGDQLPGGAKIVQISQDHLQISLNGQLMKLNLRKQ